MRDLKLYRVVYTDDCEEGEFSAYVKGFSREHAVERFNDMNEGTGWEAIEAYPAPTPQISAKHCTCHGYLKPRCPRRAQVQPRTQGGFGRAF